LSSILPEQQRAEGHVSHYGVSQNWRLKVTNNRVVAESYHPKLKLSWERDPPGRGP